ncbi:MAG: hypothetical protein KAR11_04015 [Phycisphaerae bacterium]|nr:hypothetical protein [Phycisphaerae bacterium]
MRAGKFTTLLLILAATMILGGCGTENFQKKWPEYPDWGWWHHPADEKEQPTAEAVPDKTVPSRQRPDLTTPDTVSAPAQPTEPITDPRKLAEYRKTIWPEAHQLRNLDEIPQPQRDEFVDHTKKILPQWYTLMPVDTPNTNDPDWMTTVIWDFMPEQEFDRAADTYRKIAKQQNISFPKYVTRRELMQFILQLTGGDRKSKREEPLVPLDPRKPKEGIKND